MSQSSPFSETALTVESCFGKAETGGGAALSCPAYLSLRGWRSWVGGTALIRMVQVQVKFRDPPPPFRVVLVCFGQGFVRRGANNGRRRLYGQKWYWGETKPRPNPNFANNPLCDYENRVFVLIKMKIRPCSARKKNGIFLTFMPFFHHFF